MFKEILCLVGFSICFASSARILGIVPTPSYSHQIVFQKIWQELSLRGHEVVLITTDTINNPKLTNLTEIDISFSYDVMNANFNIDELLVEMDNSVFKFMNTYIETQVILVDSVLSSPKVQELIHSKQHFDVVLAEMLQPEMFAFAELFNCPSIAISSLDVVRRVHQLIGNPAHPISYPDVLIPVAGKLTFKDRLKILLYYPISFYFKYFVTDPHKNAIIAKYFPNNSLKMDDLSKNIDMLFVNTDPILGTIRPLGPTTIPIGGGIHLHEPKSLPKELQEYLDNAKEGTIYFSLGSNVKSKSISPEKMQILLETFRELPYKIVWKFEEDNMPNKPDNVKIVKWAPQQDILRHPNVKLFISQSGYQSIEESIYNHVPILAMPFFADQERNAKQMVVKEIALIVDFKKLTKENLKGAITELITNPKYRDNAKKLATFSRDQPMTGVEKAVWWTEYVLRHKGAKHLRNPALDLPLYQYYYLDFIGVILCTYYICKFLLYKGIKKMISYRKEKTE